MKTHAFWDSIYTKFLLQLLFCMKDNGAGIPPERLSELNHVLHTSNSSSDIASDGRSVGLKNVNARPELYFGRESHLSLSSTPGLETCVSFQIPYRLPG